MADPDGVVATTFTVPAGRAGADTCTWLCRRERIAAGEPPKVTLETQSSPLPVIVTAVPPLVGPELGATEVIQPEVEASATLIRHSLAALGLPKARAIAYLERFRDAMLAARADESTEPAALPGVHEIRIGQGDFADQSLREARIRERFGVTVVGVVRRDGVVLNPAPETILRTGDVVRVFGLDTQVEAFADAAEAPWG